MSTLLQNEWVFLKFGIGGNIFIKNKLDGGRGHKKEILKEKKRRNRKRDRKDREREREIEIYTRVVAMKGYWPGLVIRSWNKLGLGLSRYGGGYDQR